MRAHKMDRTLWMVAGGAVGCGLLLALAVARNERGFNERFHAQRPPEESIEPLRMHVSPSAPASEHGPCPRPGSPTGARPGTAAAAQDCSPK